MPPTVIASRPNVCAPTVIASGPDVCAPTVIASRLDVPAGSEAILGSEDCFVGSQPMAFSQ